MDLIETAKSLYEADVKANGFPMNAPYKMHHKGVRYLVRLTNGGFVIIRPEETVQSFKFPSEDINLKD